MKLSKGPLSKRLFSSLFFALFCEIELQDYNWRCFSRTEVRTRASVQKSVRRLHHLHQRCRMSFELRVLLRRRAVGMLPYKRYLAFCCNFNARDDSAGFSLHMFVECGLRGAVRFWIDIQIPLQRAHTELREFPVQRL